MGIIGSYVMWTLPLCGGNIKDEDPALAKLQSSRGWSATDLPA